MHINLTFYRERNRVFPPFSEVDNAHWTWDGINWDKRRTIGQKHVFDRRDSYSAQNKRIDCTLYSYLVWRRRVALQRSVIEQRRCHLLQEVDVAPEVLVGLPVAGGLGAGDRVLGEVADESLLEETLEREVEYGGIRGGNGRENPYEIERWCPVMKEFK